MGFAQTETAVRPREWSLPARAALARGPRM